MKKLILILLLIVPSAYGQYHTVGLATGAPRAATLKACGIVNIPVANTCYYLSPSGSDSNNGLTTGTAWLTPNHAVNCGDAIDAAASTSYDHGNLNAGNWGTVTCPSADNVAFLTCATFDGCKIALGTNPSGIIPTASFWGVVGWEVSQDTNSAYDQCFGVGDNTTGIHHILFADNIANGCWDGGITAYQHSTTVSFDYMVVAGNAVYNAAQGNGVCGQGISFQAPIASDTNAGTHIYVANNFIWATTDPNPCQGGTTTDGSGVYFGALDGFGGGGIAAYSQQIVATNNISVGNGAPGLEMWHNTTGGTPAPFYMDHNTNWHNTNDTALNSGNYGELTVQESDNFHLTYNLSSANQATASSGATTYYAIYIENNGSGATEDHNWWYSSYGHNTGSNIGWTFGPNDVIGTDPVFASPAVPGAPSCGSYSSVPACMATMIANFTPTAGGASAYGYQPVTGTLVHDTLFPQWLCPHIVAELPVGVIENGCG